MSINYPVNNYMKKLDEQTLLNIALQGLNDVQEWIWDHRTRCFRASRHFDKIVPEHVKERLREINESQFNSLGLTVKIRKLPGRPRKHFNENGSYKKRHYKPSEAQRQSRKKDGFRLYVIDPNGKHYEFTSHKQAQELLKINSNNYAGFCRRKNGAHNGYLVWTDLDRKPGT